MKLVNPYDFFVGFELEFHNQKLDIHGANQVVKAATESGCQVAPDADGGEIQLAGYTSNLDELIKEFRTAKEALKKASGNTLSVRQGFEMNFGESLAPCHADSPRGIHFHISHRKYRFICANMSTAKTDAECYNIANDLYKRANVWRRRRHYTLPRAGTKYSTIHVITDRHIEIRCFNATFNTRGFCHALNEALMAAAKLINH